MANQFTKAYTSKNGESYPAGTQVKIKHIEAGMVILTIPSSPTPTKKLMLPISFVGRAKQPAASQQIELSPGRPLVASNTEAMSRLDQIAITYTPQQMAGNIRFTCYCGSSNIYYPANEVRSQAIENLALNKAIAACPKCTERRAHNSQKREVI